MEGGERGGGRIVAGSRAKARTVMVVTVLCLVEVQSVCLFIRNHIQNSNIYFEKIQMANMSLSGFLFCKYKIIQ